MPAFAVRLATRFSGVGDLMKALAKLRSARRCFVQAFDPAAIVSKRHLLLAYENARLAFAEKMNIAERMEAEVLARAAGTRRIDEAIARVGAKDARNVLMFWDAEGMGLVRELGAKKLKPTFVAEEKEVAKIFGISARMLASYTLEKCVLEKVAMADVE